jgi:hypothetical protein
VSQLLLTFKGVRKPANYFTEYWFYSTLVWKEC